MALPRLTEEQRKSALQKATETRQRRAQLRKQLKAGEVKAGQVLRKSEDPIVGRMKVSSLLESLPGLGKVRSKKIMEELGIDASRRIGGLGSRQRDALSAKLS